MEVQTPTGTTFHGSCQTVPVCGVSILRAGASFENAMRNCSLGPLCYGKILIQRDEKTCLPQEIYTKLPKRISQQHVLILEPVLATGGSASKAVEILKENGVDEKNIIFVNLLASRKGLDKVVKKFPYMKIVTAAVDADLTITNHIDPGLGDFGDRFYGTTG
ncbi:uracil phosphoribosyltransferase [Fusarium pseudocircinatum]|uniref:uracil phosphoribosyltransferase n=1 Tax=Fusarium pseudocircinatum TaxID=56676 RepID=A0A8H5KJI8_9HYPO|nr:uracil phosphoribosyltransferase [Fusarium pseudocircinatum]